jgi:regulator of nucleoside diphosphate kinase
MVMKHYIRPRITLSAEDYERLSALAYRARNSHPGLSAELAAELGRAHVLARGKYSKRIAQMNSEIEFRDHSSGKVQKMTLVYPEEADISKGRISVLTPVGTALIGLQAGQSINWEAPNGDLRQLTVLSVRAREFA